MNPFCVLTAPTLAGLAPRCSQSRRTQSRCNWLKLITLLASFVFAPLASQGAIISYEPFSGYTVPAELQSAGNPTVAGYTGAWSDADFGNAEPGTLSGSLDYTNPLYLPETGDRVGVAFSNTPSQVDASNSGRVYRLFDSSLTVTNSTAGTRYLSFLFQRGTGGGTNVYQTLALYNSGTDTVAPVDQNRNFDIGVNGSTTYNFGVENGTGQTNHSTGVTTDTAVHLFVVKFTLSASANSDSVTVWVDPTLGGVGDPAGGTTVSGRNLTWDRLVFSDYDDNSAAWDEIRWGDSFNAVTIPEPGTISMLLFGCVAFWLIGRKRGSLTIG